MVIWLIGLSGAGKTTIGQLLYQRLKAQHPNTVNLDGDILREVWGGDLGYAIEGRRTNAHRISHLCRLLDRQGIHVIAAVLSIFPDWQTWNRTEFSSYFEVFLDVPMAELERRDAKGLYAKAKRGEINNVAGIDLPFPRPAYPDLVLDGAQVTATPHEIVAAIERVLPGPLGPRI